MNFFDNTPNFNNIIPQGIQTPIINNNIDYKIHELENKITKLEQRISILETDKQNNNYIETDNSMYMI